jgi:hypothetical protein
MTHSIQLSADVHQRGGSIQKDSRARIIIIIIIIIILYYLCAELTATRPITDTAQCRYTNNNNNSIQFNSIYNNNNNNNKNAIIQQ